MFDAELNSVSDEIILKYSHFRKSKTFSKIPAKLENFHWLLMCKLTHESLRILTLVMFDAELNSLSHEIIFKGSHFGVSTTLS